MKLILTLNTGWNGLVNAKTFIEVNPSAKVIIFDKAKTIGGVWAKERLYPGLKSNNMVGNYEFSDFPMTEERFGVKSGQHVPGSVVHEYLLQYAEEFDIQHRIRFSSEIQTAELQEESSGWLLTVLSKLGSSGCSQSSHVRAQRLIVATGLTSDPFIPNIAGHQDFGALSFHSKEFGDHADSLNTARNVVVYGSSKSAWDVAYEYASRDVQVDLVIRGSGQGPGWMSPPLVTPLKLRLERLIFTRVLTWFNPCAWGEADGYDSARRFLHGTWLGRKFVLLLWFILGHYIGTQNGYDQHPATRKLKPWNDPFWNVSIINYDSDFFELVRHGRINVNVADITHLTSKTVHISDGTTIFADTLVYCTGWSQRPSITFLPSGIESAIGLPYHSIEPNLLAEKADKEILSRFPALRHQPPTNPHYKALTSKTNTTRMDAPQNSKAPNQPYRLYRFLVPPPSRLVPTPSIAFPGAHISAATVPVAQAQALWLTAYFSNKISHLRSTGAASEASVLQSSIAWDTTLHSQFGRWRHPSAGDGFGSRFPDMAFESLPYVDLLLRDLGLKRWRKGGLWREWFEPYGLEDYKGLVSEWMETVKHPGGD